MQLVVEREELAGVAEVARVLLLRNEVLELRDVVAVGALCREANRRALERLAQELRVVDAGHADAADEGAELRDDPDELVVAQPRERLAHRRAADAELVGDLVLRDLPPGLELGRDDRVAHCVVDREAGTAAVRAGNPGESAGRDICILAYKLRSVNVSPTPVAGTAFADQAISRDLLAQTARGEIDAAVRIWAPVPALALSRLDELRAGAAAARDAAARHSLDTVRRVSGGHAVVVGAGSFCVGFAEPATTFEGTQARYERLTRALIDGFASVGVSSERGELEGEWCPGSWSIRSGGVKLAGLAQRAIKGAAWAEAVVDLAPDARTRELLADVYAALELPLDPATLGSVPEVAGRPVEFGELAEPLLAALSD